MTRRRRTIDRELLILLAIFVALAMAAQIAGRSAGFVVVTETPPVIVEVSPAVRLYDASTNPYWAPTHAFTRRPAPLYSSDAVPAAMPTEATPLSQ